MDKKYVIGVDIGTQSTRIIIYDQFGMIVSEGKQNHIPLYQPGPGMAEHPGDDIWDSFRKACRSAINNFSGNIKEISAIGLSSQRCALALVNENGKLLFPIMSWLDKRTYVPIESLDIYSEVKKYLTCSGYICKKLTGEFNDTVSNFVGQWPMDNDNWCWSNDPAVIEHYNMPLDKLATVKLPGTVLGYVTEEGSSETGLPVGCAVIATAGDKQVESLGGGAYKDGQAYVSCGTFVGCDIVGSKNRTDGTAFWSFLGGIPHTYNYEGNGVRRGFWTVSWFRNQFGEAVRDDCEKLGAIPEEIFNNEAEQVPAGCDGLITIPDWAPPSDKQYRKGAMIGFDGRHTRGHMYRSILEGIALSLKNNTDEMCNELGIELKNLNIGGGGSLSRVGMQIFSDVFGIPVITNKVYESCSLGAAIEAAVGAGIYKTFDEAVPNMVHTREIYYPNEENVKIYKQLNETVYKEARNHLDPMLKEISKLVD